MLGLGVAISAIAGQLLTAADDRDPSAAGILFALSWVIAALGVILLSQIDPLEGQPDSQHHRMGWLSHFRRVSMLVLLVLPVIAFPLLFPIVAVGILAARLIKRHGGVPAPVSRMAGAVLVFIGGAGIAYMIIAGLLSIPRNLRDGGPIVILVGTVAIPLFCAPLAALILIGRHMWRVSPSGRSDEASTEAE